MFIKMVDRRTVAAVGNSLLKPQPPPYDGAAVLHNLHTTLEHLQPNRGLCQSISRFMNRMIYLRLFQHWSRLIPSLPVASNCFTTRPVACGLMVLLPCLSAIDSLGPLPFRHHFCLYLFLSRLSHPLHQFLHSLLHLYRPSRFPFLNSTNFGDRPSYFPSVIESVAHAPHESIILAPFIWPLFAHLFLLSLHIPLLLPSKPFIEP
ncbi:hypothetical protein BKA59DRAFT_101515 [Fusarium tricinctum]|uniref:Uncharacterized protein n=1 Tax=Fusarium tricinctum TaxID=61284 RepID=A0A8K0S4T0_9HYPO|nr:hypothetical protein BKA59DRAFT_101515 [Fusarium tricinctum]